MRGVIGTYRTRLHVLGIHGLEERGRGKHGQLQAMILGTPVGPYRPYPYGFCARATSIHIPVHHTLSEIEGAVTDTSIRCKQFEELEPVNSNSIVVFVSVYMT